MPPSAFKPMMPGWSTMAEVVAEMHRNEPLKPVEHRLHSPIDLGDPGFFKQLLPIENAARKFMSENKPEAALEKYKEGIPIIVGDGIEVPLSSAYGGGMRSTKYIQMPLDRRLALMQVCNQIGELLINMNRYKEALSWFLEVYIIYKNGPLDDKGGAVLFDWFDINIPFNSVYVERIKAMMLSSNVFLKLGNTSMAAYRRHEGTKLALGDLPGFDKMSLEGKDWATDLLRLPTVRHPDPKLSLNLEIQNKDLQRMGSWSKIHIPSDKNIQPRCEFASFVWNGTMWLAVKSPWVGWLAFPSPSYPIRQAMGGRMSNWRMAVHDNKAYIFCGSPVVDYFDLVVERWSSVNTKFPASIGGARGPFPMGDLQDYSMISYNGKLYVFGGTYEKCEVGNNLFIELDLKTFQWRRLSGFPGPKLIPEYNCPGPRRFASMWIDSRVKGEERIFLLYGDADRVSAQQGGQSYGSSLCYTYGDMWSWHIGNEAWRRERIDGNPPCPRSEIACSFNEKMGVTVLFGGYSPTLQTYLPEQNKFHSFTYFGDTYVYIHSPSSSEPPMFKQVITRGFPSYRAGAHLFTDPETGKIYLFGGYTNSQLIPEPRNDFIRSYADLWQLKLDMPGGNFEGVNLEEEARTAKAGPWQRCFNCGNAGPWKKCGGSCNGRAFFCDSQCLKEGWKEHKMMHNCKKK